MYILEQSQLLALYIGLIQFLRPVEELIGILDVGNREKILEAILNTINTFSSFSVMINSSTSLSTFFSSASKMECAA